MTTWSVVGVDPETGDVGVAVASCVPRHGDAVAALVPGKGAAATQAGFDVRNRNRVFELLQEGLKVRQRGLFVDLERVHDRGGDVRDAVRPINTLPGVERHTIERVETLHVLHAAANGDDDVLPRHLSKNRVRALGKHLIFGQHSSNYGVSPPRRSTE